ncbi:MAG: transcription antitermination factor NusB [Deltaproteobacteria bacterium]|nr:transcription antitermination factor NusB [Deltaproteobacteria bacterium]MDQ3297415.1 transcription antitermination factor NusB [Myxococcota bacterium]
MTSGGTGIRRSGRAYALQLLYARDGDPATDVTGAAVSWADTFDLEIEPQAQLFARDLVAASTTRGAEIDELITTSSKNWRIDRMSRVDRNILRLGACELLAFHDVPVKVVINEAVELAKRFGTAESSAFVNGVLDRIASAVGRSSES